VRFRGELFRERNPPPDLRRQATEGEKAAASSLRDGKRKGLDLSEKRKNVRTLKGCRGQEARYPRYGGCLLPRPGRRKKQRNPTRAKCPKEDQREKGNRKSKKRGVVGIPKGAIDKRSTCRKGTPSSWNTKGGGTQKMRERKKK